jgi:hypothetical protein
MLSMLDFKNAEISDGKSSRIVGSSDPNKTYDNYIVTWTGNYGTTTHTAEDRRYDPNTPGMHELCDIIVD